MQRAQGLGDSAKAPGCGRKGVQRAQGLGDSAKAQQWGGCPTQGDRKGAPLLYTTLGSHLGVQRAKPFAGVWGVPTYTLFAAVGGAITKSSNCKPEVDSYVAEETIRT